MTAVWVGPSEGKKTRLNPPAEPVEAIITVRDRAGFMYERRVKPRDFVSLANVGALLRKSIPTVHYWVSMGKLPTRSRKVGNSTFELVKLADVYQLARELGLHPERSRRGLYFVG